MAISIGNNLYNYSSISSNNADNLVSKINGKNYENATDDELMEVCKEFESYFVEQCFKEMQKTVDAFKSDDEENEYEEMFGDMMVQEYAKKITDSGSIGLAKQLYEQMQNQRKLS